MQHTKKDCKFDPKIKVVGKMLLPIKYQKKVSLTRPKEMHDEKNVIPDTKLIKLYHITMPWIEQRHRCSNQSKTFYKDILFLKIGYDTTNWITLRMSRGHC